jgi:hypothetical protein
MAEPVVIDMTPELFGVAHLAEAIDALKLALESARRGQFKAADRYVIEADELLRQVGL